MSGEGRLPLGSFRGVDVPDVTCIKFVYSDARMITASSNQAEYVYRPNSLFDPDFSGVGGQPDGFDQWKALYGVYRVVAVDYEVQAAGASAFGLLAVAPATTSASILSAEEVAGLRHAKSCLFTTTQRCTLRGSFRVSEVLGKEDVAVLADPNNSAAVTTNPTEQIFLHVTAETTGASDLVWIFSKITMYTRLEAPFTLIDSVAKHRFAFERQLATLPSVSPVTSPVASGAPICGANTKAGISSASLVRR